MGPVIIVFAKAPRPGHVKTRLIPHVSPPEAAALHAAFVRDTVESLEAVADLAAAELHVDIETDAWSDLSLTRRLQNAGDLGLKMQSALSFALHRGHSRAVILGSDSPTLPTGHLRALAAADADIVLGPTCDGGYYAIAARRTDPMMFSGVRWSTAHALDDTLRACAGCGLTTTLGPAWFDVDDAAGCEMLRRSPILPRHTAAALADISRRAGATREVSAVERA